MNSANHTHPDGSPRFAYFTLVARDKYVDGAVCLVKSLRDKTRFPLIAMTNELSAKAQDRLTTISSVERKRVIEETRRAQERMRKIREAMQKKAAEESAAKASRE